MKICRPLWAEGTFLSSQQFQQQARWEAFSNDSIAQLCIRHPWGIANVLFDRDALTPGKLKTQAVRLRFADGTLIDSDVADILPPACDLRTLEGGSAIVLLALPLAHGNGGNLGQGEQAERPLRYRQEWQKVQDIYGSDSEDMAVERHALSLRFAHDNNQDYITCPLARLVRDVQGNWTQDESYIPPLLAFNAHDGLVQRLDTLLLQLRAKCQRLMAMRRESNQRMADFAVADVSLFWLLNALNSAEPVLSDFLRYPAVHPELVWRELARLAGALLTFSLEHNVSAVPPYVHESPSTVFPPLFSLLSELLEASLPSRVIALDLASLPGNRWKADLHDPRLREEADFYLSVRSSLPAHQVLHQLPLVCKIGAPDDVTLLINVALNGVPLVPLTSVPAALPLRLEAYDISNFAGQDTVGSMVVFVEGQPKKSAYRKFKIACAASGQDDYASMREMLTRRVQRYVDGDEKFAPLPSAFMIDGGLGHVRICKEVLDSFGLSVPCFGMVKDDHHRTRALVAPDGREFGISATPALFGLVGRLQEEVHRFAIEYNRKLGGKRVRGSTLDRIPGVGDKRRTELLKHFGSIENIRQASEQELARILPRNTAQSVYEFFHENE